MITVLSVHSVRRRGPAGLFDRLRGDKVITRQLQSRGVAVRRVEVYTRRSKPGFERADKAVGAARSRIVCAEGVALPEKRGYRRFVSDSFSARICGNMFLAVLREAKRSPSVRVGLYDPDAAAADILMSVLEYCCDVKAVTRRTDRYAAAAKRALEEMGASAVITQRSDELGDRDFVLAPTNIAEPLALNSACVTLTVGEPRLGIGGTAYTEYRLRMPKGFEQLKPDELSSEYFCSALYTLGGRYELGSLVPYSCANRFGSQTVKSLAALLDSRR